MNTLIPVVVKKGKLRSSQPYWGGLLNPKAHDYVRRVSSKNNPQPTLEQIKKEL